MKNIKPPKKRLFILFSIIIILFLITLVQTSLPVFSQEGNSLDYHLLTGPYLKFDSETEINAPLNVKGPINFIASDEFRGEINIADLTGNRNYILPNLSGEICLSAGNCLLAPLGTTDRLAKFTAQGLNNSSIQDLSQDLSIFIDNEGRVGIGTDNPGYKLHVAGRIQAQDDICTDLQRGRCLSDLEKLSSLFEATIGGEGSADRVPLWKENYKLGDSEIYQSGQNVGVGTTPSFKLDVAGTVRMLGFRLPVSPNEGFGLVSDEAGFGSWQPVLLPRDMHRDIAENFLINPDCHIFDDCPEPGDLVSVSDNEFIEKSSTPYDRRLIGIISTAPALTLGGNLDLAESRPVALIGRVPTKVSLENGPIQIGDLLTSSLIPGAAKKAIGPGRVVGMALESLPETDFQNCENKNPDDQPKVLDCQEKIGKIDVLINLHNIY